MPFQEGNTLGGRKHGSVSKETKVIREWIANFLTNNLNQFEEDINSLEPKDRVKAVSDLMEYAVPKLARIENINENEGHISISIVDHRTDSEETTPSPEANTPGSETV